MSPQLYSDLLMDKARHQKRHIEELEARLRSIVTECEAELDRIELDGGMAGFAERIVRLAQGGDK